MKNIKLSIPLFFCLFQAAQAQQSFVISGDLVVLKSSSMITLKYIAKSGNRVDTAYARNGSFVLKGKIETPVKATLSLLSMGKEQIKTSKINVDDDQQMFYIDPGKTFVSGSNFRTAVIQGGKSQGEFQTLQMQLQPFKDRMKPLSEKMREILEKKDETAQKELFPQLRSIRLEMDSVENEFIYRHPDSYVSFDLVKSKATFINPEKFAPFFFSLSGHLRNSTQGKALAERLIIAKKTDIGQPAPVFTQTNTEGIPVKLSSLKGKYVLLDFWASWCGPCREENPNLLKAYQKFKIKNFEIISVSLDTKKELWLKAIKNDGLPWIHVSDLKGWKNNVAVIYDVQAVPQNFLLAPDGLIIAKNLRGEDLDGQLTKLIKDDR